MVQEIDIDLTISRVKEVLQVEAELSPVARKAVEGLLLVAALVNQLALNELRIDCARNEPQSIRLLGDPVVWIYIVIQLKSHCLRRKTEPLHGWA